MVKRSVETVGSVGSRRSGVRVWRRLWLSGDDRHADCYGWRPPTNLYETRSGGIVQVEIAGLQEGSYRVAFADGCLSIVGDRELPRSTDPVACHRMEIASGRFTTRVEVPWSVDTESIQVDYGDGLLEVRLPRATSGEGPVGTPEGEDA